MKFTDSMSARIQTGLGLRLALLVALFITSAEPTAMQNGRRRAVQEAAQPSGWNLEDEVEWWLGDRFNAETPTFQQGQQLMYGVKQGERSGASAQFIATNQRVLQWMTNWVSKRSKICKDSTKKLDSYAKLEKLGRMTPAMTADRDQRSADLKAAYYLALATVRPEDGPNYLGLPPDIHPLISVYCDLSASIPEMESEVRERRKEQIAALTELSNLMPLGFDELKPAARELKAIIEMIDAIDVNKAKGADYAQVQERIVGIWSFLKDGDASDVGQAQLNKPRASFKTIALPEQYAQMDGEALVREARNMLANLQAKLPSKSVEDFKQQLRSEALTRYVCFFGDRMLERNNSSVQISGLRDIIERKQRIGQPADSDERKLEALTKRMTELEKLPNAAIYAKQNRFSIGSGAGLDAYLTDMLAGQSTREVKQGIQEFQAVASGVLASKHNNYPKIQDYIRQLVSEADEVIALIDKDNIEQAQARCEAIWNDVIEGHGSGKGQRVGQEVTAQVLYVQGDTLPGYDGQVPTDLEMTAIIFNGKGDLVYSLGNRIRGTFAIYQRNANGKTFPILVKPKGPQETVQFLEFSDDGTLTWMRGRNLVQSRNGKDTYSLPTYRNNLLAATSDFVAYFEHSNSSIMAGTPAKEQAIAEKGKGLPGLPSGLVAAGSVNLVGSSVGNNAVISCWFEQYKVAAPAGSGRNPRGGASRAKPYTGYWLLSPKGLECIAYPTMALPDGSKLGEDQVRVLCLSESGTVIVDLPNAKREYTRWIYASGKLSPFNPSGCDDVDRLVLAKFLQGDRLVLATHGGVTWTGDMNSIHILEQDAPVPKEWSSSGAYSLFNRTANVYSIGNETQLHEVLHPEDLISFGSDPGQTCSSRTLLGIAPSGQSVFQLRFADALGLREGPPIYCLLESPLN